MLELPLVRMHETLGKAGFTLSHSSKFDIIVDYFVERGNYNVYILYKLLSYPKKTFSRAQLMDEFWGVDTDTSLRAVDVYITKLRDKFSACDGFEIKTVRGLGYKAVLK